MIQTYFKINLTKCEIISKYHKEPMKIYQLRIQIRNSLNVFHPQFNKSPGITIHENNQQPP